MRLMDSVAVPVFRVVHRLSTVLSTGCPLVVHRLWIDLGCSPGQLVRVGVTAAVVPGRCPDDPPVGAEPLQVPDSGASGHTGPVGELLHAGERSGPVAVSELLQSCIASLTTRKTYQKDETNPLLNTRHDLAAVILE